MALTFQRERFASIISELPRLFALHWAELGSDDDLAPKWHKMAAMDASGLLHCITVRADGVLVGYAFMIICESLHYNHVTAVSDGLFLDHDYRRWTNGIRLLRFTEKYLADNGVRKIYLIGRVGHDLSKLFKRLGFSLFEEIYQKVL